MPPRVYVHSFFGHNPNPNRTPTCPPEYGPYPTTVSLTIRLTQKTSNAVDRCCRDEGVARAILLREWIEEGLLRCQRDGCRKGIR